MAKTYKALLKAGKEYRLKIEEEPARRTPETGGAGVDDGHALKLPIETFRTLRHNILAACPVCKTPALLFSGAAPKEGNSTVLVNFARSLAAGGEQVILVDGNLENPTLHKLLDMGNHEGVSELLRWKGDGGQLVKATRFNNLSLVSAGSSGPALSCPFERAVVHSLIEALRPVSDWVLFDSSPINASNDGVVISSEVDGVVLILRAEKTRWEVAQNAVHRLRGAGGNVVGVVLNRRRMPIPGWIYRRL